VTENTLNLEPYLSIRVGRHMLSSMIFLSRHVTRSSG